MLSSSRIAPPGLHSPRRTDNASSASPVRQACSLRGLPVLLNSHNPAYIETSSLIARGSDPAGRNCCGLRNHLARLSANARTPSSLPTRGRRVPTIRDADAPHEGRIYHFGRAQTTQSEMARHTFRVGMVNGDLLPKASPLLRNISTLPVKLFRSGVSMPSFGAVNLDLIVLVLDDIETCSNE